MVSEAPQHQRLFFAPAWKLSVAAVAAVAVVAMAAWLLGPQFGGGHVGSQSPGPGASMTVEPTPSAEPTPTVGPTAVPTPGVAAWTGLDWTAGSTGEDGVFVVTSSSAPTQPGYWFSTATTR